MASEPRVTAVPSNVPPFAHEFVTRMRKHLDARVKPSVRQTQAIPQLLSARYFRNGKLTLDDFIDAAVYTTYPHDQQLARTVAEDIVLGRKEKQAEHKLVIEEGKKQQSQKKKTQLAAVLEQIQREQELAKTIKKDKVKQGFDYLQELRSRDDSTLYDAALQHLREGDIVLRGITSDEELKEEAAREISEKMGALKSEEILSARTLDCLDDICDHGSTAEKLAAKALRGDRDLKEEFDDLAEQDPSTAAKALRLMEEMGKPGKAKRKSMDKSIQDNISDLSEARDYASELGRTPDNISEMIDQAPSQYPLADAMQFAQEIKDATGKDHTSEVLEAYDQQFDSGASDNIDMRQLAEVAKDDPSWQSLVDKKTKENLDKAQSRSSPSDFLQQQLAELEKLESKMPSKKSEHSWDEAKQQIADGAVESSPTRTHLRQTVRACTRMGTVPSRQTVQDAGGRLGMSEAEVLELLNPSFRVIKQLIQQGVSDFDRLHSLMTSAGLSYKQLKELADIAAAQDNQGALGAIAHENLHAALGSREGPGRGTPGGRVDAERAGKVFGGLIGGPATNIIRMWYSYRDELPPELKERLRKIAQRLLVDLGMRFARQTMGTSMLGGIQLSTTVRPFRIGDDIDLIDLEETIDHLLSEGRTSFDMIEPEDFRIVETYQGHRAFFWGLDKSGSMDSAEKLGMLAISVMAGLYAVQRDDFGVVLFDHQTHIVKKISEKSVSIEKVASDLLEARAGGGSGGASTMRLALENFEESRAKEKIFVFSTDMYLSDQMECESLAKQLKQQDIRLIIIVPKTSYDPHAAQSLARAAHGVVLDIGSVEELPEKLLRVTNY